ncbi:hypothetical protein K7432_006737 [Basidiobolus ranarum]|uniref:Yeast cell wall synthesis Kre9/Knh1-like N-terminal domain-containing protein n=1 Tax=Basidiobolus ranarum TaxID=34480 RepID=A0ABR2WUN2_9FUNG
MKLSIFLLVSLAIFVYADISIYAPGNNAIDAGSKVAIKWEGEPKNTTKSVNLDLMTGSSSHFTEVSKITKNLGSGNRSFTWEVPKDIASGRYVIKMSGKKDEAYYGSYFEIKNPALPEKTTTPEASKESKKPGQVEKSKKSFGNMVSVATFNLTLGIFCFSYLLNH